MPIERTKPASLGPETPYVVEICHKAIAAFGSPCGMEEADDFATLARAYLALDEQLRALTPEGSSMDGSGAHSNRDVL